MVDKTECLYQWYDWFGKCGKSWSVKVTTNKMSVITRGNAIEVISLNLCISTKKTFGLLGRHNQAQSWN